MFDIVLAVSLSGGFGGGLASVFGSGLAETATTILTQYGYLALLLFVFAETSMLFPFLPTELVVPAAAVLLVTGPLSLVAFVSVAAIGAVLVVHDPGRERLSFLRHTNYIRHPRIYIVAGPVDR